MNWGIIFHSFFIKMRELLQTLWGWFLILCSFIVNFIGDYKVSVVAVIIAVALDAFWGIWAAVKQGKYARSELMRDTISKIAAYGSAILITIMIERVKDWESMFVTCLIAVLICATELWSISGNILIVNPNAVFFKLLRPALKGEIARKLGIEEEKVDEVLDNGVKQQSKNTNDHAKTE